ncbi:MAG: hypothetical protein Q3996_01720 [Candidatus Saccharibacteria bacterium]|nr:hypothetical protein [Candidatus Saccharibacteria bacterium]
MDILIISISIIVAIFLVTVLVGAPYVPTHTKQFNKLLKSLKFDSTKTVLVDLGSGDGKVLRLANKNIKRGIGYEINPILWMISKILSTKYNKLDFRLADFRRIKLPDDTTAVYIFFAGTYEKDIASLLMAHAEKTSCELQFVSYGFEFRVLGEPELIQYGFYCYKIKPSKKTKKSV